MVSGLLFFYCLWYLNETSQICWTAKVTYYNEGPSLLPFQFMSYPPLINLENVLTCSSFTIWNIWMKLHRYVDHQRLHIVTKDVISLSISVLLLFRHYISPKKLLVPPAVAGYYAVLLLIGSSSFLQATRKLIISQMGSKFSRIRPGTWVTCPWAFGKIPIDL